MAKLETYSIKNWTVFGRNRFSPPFKISDSLINEARIVYVVNGSSRLYSAKQYINLNSGDLFIMKADNFINDWKINEDGLETEVIVFQLKSDLLSYLYGDEPPDGLVQSKEKKVVDALAKVSPSPLIKSYFETLRNYLNEASVLNEQIILLKTKEIISLIINLDSQNGIKHIFSSLFQKRDYSFQEVIQKNLYESLNLEDLAFLTNNSLSTFKRKFQSIYGTTPNKYFVSKRLEKAQNLLMASQLNIAEIAYDCGFSDESYFTKTFKKYYNITPTEFRKST
ncbi:MAG: AraC family transcriptional regulator [Flavobacteriales bacterium]|nr:AraC family transcriptional regulator [Flavobacteriales bacterium]